MYRKILEAQENSSAVQDLAALLALSDSFVKSSKTIVSKEKSINLKLERQSHNAEQLQTLVEAAVEYAKFLSQQGAAAGDIPTSAGTVSAIKSVSPSKISSITDNRAESPLFEPLVESAISGAGNSKPNRIICIYIHQLPNKAQLERKGSDTPKLNPVDGKRIRKSLERPGMVPTVEHIPAHQTNYSKKQAKSVTKTPVPRSISRSSSPESPKVAENLLQMFHARHDGSGSASTRQPRQLSQVAMSQGVRPTHESDDESA
jgi:hypothetical protein